MFIDRIHDVRASGVGTDGEPSTECLPIGGEVRGDTVVFLGASGGEAEPGHHLVEHEDDATLPCDLAKALQEPGRRAEASVERFHDDGGQVGGIGFDDGGRPVQVVIGGDEDVPFDPRRAGAGV